MNAHNVVRPIPAATTPRLETTALRRFVPLAALIAVAAVLRFALLDQQSFWYDEAWTVGLLQKSLFGMLAALSHREATPPLYFALAWVWSRVFGSGEVGLRALSALLGTATVPVSYMAGRVLVSHRTGLFAAALVTFSPLLIWYSQEARAYALLAFLSALSLLAFGFALQRPTPRALAFWAVVACLALATHYFSVFLLGPQAAWLLFAHRQRRAAWVAVGAAAAAELALLPLAREQQHVPTGWIAAIPLATRVREVLRQFVTGQYQPLSHVAIMLTLLALGLVVAGLVYVSEGRERQGGAIALTLGAIAVLAPLALTTTHFDKFYYRNLIGAWIPLAIAFAIVCASRRAGRFGYAVVAAACALELASAVAVFDRSALQRDDWRSATKAVGSKKEARAIITDPFFERVAIELYRPTTHVMAAAGAQVREIVFLGHSPLPLQFRPPTGFELVEQRRIQNLALVRFRSAVPRTVTPKGLAARGGLRPSGVLLDSGSSSESTAAR